MKTKLLFLILILCACLPLSAQQKSVTNVDKDGIYQTPEKLPEYPGGIPALMNFLKTNVKYPVQAMENKISGRVIIQFVVMKDGSLEDVQVARGVDPLLDAEAMRVVKMMPKWTPGMHNGAPVKVSFTVPVMFSLAGDDSKARMPHGFTIPVGQEIKDRSLEGTWQSCNVYPGDKNYRVVFGPILKVLSGDKTFMNIFTGDGKVSAAILAQGSYEMKSECSYTETIGQSLGQGPFTTGVKNEISVEFLNDKLVKFTFMIPGRAEPWQEYWFRIPKPGDSGFSNTSLIANR